MTNQQVQRIWKIGAARITDPCSALPFAQSFEILAKSHPQVRHTTVFESDGIVQEDGSVLYEIQLLPAKTNG
ncbi:hypothetical protein [Vibrio sp.]|uniref:hypothetical protein n=1 Tax=Vibrio sp. TaxID=678 RepID=UPI003D098C16